METKWQQKFLKAGKIKNILFMLNIINQFSLELKAI